MHAVCTLYPYRLRTRCTLTLTLTLTLILTLTLTLTLTRPNPNPNPNQVHAWVQLHFRRLKQRQAALLGIPPHKFTSKL